MARTAKTRLKILDEGVEILFADTLDFVGGGVTASDFGNSIGQISVSGGASGSNVSSERLSGTQSGDNVTLDLTGLAHTFVGILGVYRNGQKLTPNDTSSGWTISGSTVTVYGASAGNDFLIDYTY